MRYLTINTISFTDDFGDDFAIKDIRPIPDTYSLKDTVTLRANDRIDEIASRPEYYGDEAEAESYRIVDFNLERLYEAKFNLARIRTLKIPLR